jgi:hypothetical protein
MSHAEPVWRLELTHTLLAAAFRFQASLKFVHRTAVQPLGNGSRTSIYDIEPVIIAITGSRHTCVSVLAAVYAVGCTVMHPAA